ncbi:holo-ACP synthase [Streptomyces sp. NPDC052013]|uniref:holo-ACP synthase n=1 Tax=unclassified Streptomyces TaxID=2593676 RepID=UPI0021B37659|nr:holo-ACP synthase [Streptomyces sp. 15-116A]
MTRPTVPGAAAVRAVGIDVVGIGRLRTMLERRGQPLLDRLLTPAEQALCQGASARHRAACLAGRVAAKEAVRKTLGGHGEGCGWRDVEIGREPSGAPVPRLTGRAARAFRSAGLSRLHLSITHEAGVAVAIAVAV